MNESKRNNFVLNWELAYVGVVKDLLSPNDVLLDIDVELFNKLNDDQIVELYLAIEKSKDSFLVVLNSIKKIDENLFKMGLRVWSLAFLNDISASNKVISSKLKDIANIWAMFDYPESWKNFIYYMPVESGEESDENRIYSNFVEFLKLENTRLR